MNKFITLDGKSNANASPEAQVEKLKTSLTDNSLGALGAGINSLYAENPDASAVDAFYKNYSTFNTGFSAKIDPVITQIYHAQMGIAAGNNAEDPATVAAMASQLKAAKVAGRILAQGAETAAHFNEYHLMSSRMADGDMAQPLDGGLNAFDPADYRSIVARSIAYTPASMAQGVAAELLFTTIAVTPDQANYQFRVIIPTLHMPQTRNKDGKEFDLHARRLIDATRYQEVLRNDIIDIIPMYKVSRSDVFVDPAEIQPWEARRGDQTFLTSAFRMGASFDLIAMNQAEENPNRGSASERDMLDRGVAIKTLFLKVTNKTGQSSVFSLDVHTKPTATFQAQNIADSANELKVALREALQVNALTPTTTGQPATVLQSLLSINPNVSITLKTDANGDVDTERANIVVDSFGKVKIGEIYERSLTGTRRKNVTDPATLAAVAEAFDKVELIAWYPHAKLRNTTLRDIGQVVRVQAQLKAYPIEMQSPFTAQSPAGQENTVEKSELRKLAFTAARIDNDMSAHRTFWENLERLRSHKGLNKDIGNVNWDRLGYVSDPYIDPCFDEIDVDLLRDINNVTTGQKFQDITSLLALNITDLAMTLIRESNINAALEMLGAPNYKVSIVAITDPYIAAYIRTIGDARTAGTEHKVITTSVVDELWRDKITLSLRVDLEGDASILNTGFHLAVPRYVTDLTFPRDGAVANEVTIHNRRQYVMTTPIGGIIHVKNLSQAVRHATRFKVSL